MAENKQKQPEIPAEVKKIQNQAHLVAEIKKAIEKEPSDELNLRLLRERDTLRHLRLVQKGTPLERAKTKANYAAKAALSRAIQPVEE
jgi:hypothetical protein